MPDPLFRGAITALATPFHDDAIDWAALERLLDRQVEAGIHGIVPVGTTGETATLSPDEHKRVVSFCVEKIAGRIPVIAGAGSNSTAEAIDLVRHAEAAGAQGALVVTPYYNRPSQEGMRRHYAAIAQACGLPVVIYNVPSRTGSDIATDTVLRLCELPTIAGVKDATGDLSRVSLMRVKAREDFALLSGDDPSALGYVAQGGHGVISVTSNVAPEACARWMDAAIAGRFAEALEWQDRLIALHKALFLDSSPAPTKFALAALGLCKDEVRLPIAPCAEAARPAIREAMTIAGL